MSTTAHTREMNYGVFERFGFGLSFLSGELQSPRAPFRILTSFSGMATSRLFRTSGDCSNNRTLLGFVAQGLVVEKYGVGSFKAPLG